MKRCFLVLFGLLLWPRFSSAEIVGLPSFADLVEQLSPSVVNISTTPKDENTEPHSEFLNGTTSDSDIFSSSPSGHVALGSGFILDEEGYIYPQMEITMNASGDLEIYNDIEDRTMFIKNCKQGEVIKLDYPVIETSLASHKIQNDFNWRFLRIAKTYRENANHLTISLPCTIKLTYTPRIKIGLQEVFDYGYQNYIRCR